MVNISLEAWKKLTPEQQKALTDLGQKMEPDFWAVSAQGDKDAIAKLTANGMGLIAPPSAGADDDTVERSGPTTVKNALGRRCLSTLGRQAGAGDDGGTAIQWLKPGPAVELLRWPL